MYTLPPDINECLTGRDNCNSNADCVNADGNFQCSCRAGFQGNGVSCTGIIVCKLPFHIQMRGHVIDIVDYNQLHC